MRKCYRMTLIAFLFVETILQSSHAHVEEGSGEILQLYSYRTSNPPIMNGSLGDTATAEGSASIDIDSNQADEWRDAYVRTIPVYTADSSNSKSATLYFCNDDNWLYLGLATNFNNAGNNVTARFMFDQGASGGNHNDNLDGGGDNSDNGEYRLHITTNSDGFQEYSWNDTSWQLQESGGSVAFIGKGVNFGTSLQQIEIKIPLSGNSADDTHSYLNVQDGQELGFYFEIKFSLISHISQKTDLFLRLKWLDIVNKQWLHFHYALQ